MKPTARRTKGAKEALPLPAPYRSTYFGFCALDADLARSKPATGAITSITFWGRVHGPVYTVSLASDLFYGFGHATTGTACANLTWVPLNCTLPRRCALWFNSASLSAGSKVNRFRNAGSRATVNMVQQFVSAVVS